MNRDYNMSTLIKNTFPHMFTILNREIRKISQHETLSMMIYANFNKVFSVNVTDVPNTKFYFRLKHNQAEHLNHGAYNEDYRVSINSDTYVAILNGDMEPMDAFSGRYMTIEKVE